MFLLPGSVAARHMQPPLQVKQVDVSAAYQSPASSGCIVNASTQRHTAHVG